MSVFDNTPYKLSNWVPIDKISWEKITNNPRAIQLLEQHPDKSIGGIYP